VVEVPTVEYYAGGFLQEKRILSTCDDLFDVEKHFAAARAIYVEGLTRHGYGWRSWGLRPTFKPETVL